MLTGSSIPTYFNAPTQIYFRYPDMEEKRYVGGIAFQDNIISGEDGEVIPLSHVTELNPYSNWIAISDEIIGG